MAQKALKVNSFVIRVETSAINKFNLFQIVETVSKDPDKPTPPREAVIAYAIPLKKVVEIITFRESVTDPLIDIIAFLQKQEAKIESLLSKFDRMEKAFYENMK